VRNSDEKMVVYHICIEAVELFTVGICIFLKFGK